MRPATASRRGLWPSLALLAGAIGLVAVIGKSLSAATAAQEADASPPDFSGVWLPDSRASARWPDPRPYTKAMLDQFAPAGFDVFAGSEEFLLANMRGGGKGCITATGNINPAAIDRLYRNWRAPDADALQAGITATRKLVQKQPMIPALKAAIAHFGNDPQWKTCRPPLVELNAGQEETLIRDLKASGFSMPGLAA